MRVWIVKTGEPLPGAGRRMRSGRLAATLAERGHEVVLWASTFSHQQKRHIYDAPQFLECGPNQRLVLLHGEPYSQNISVARLRNHRQEARQFSALAAQEPAPDVILSCLPTLDLCEAALRFAEPRDIPVIIDIRDQWPDMFTYALPEMVRPLGALALAPLFRQRDYIVRRARAITAVSDSFVEWGLRSAARAATNWDRAFPSSYDRPLLSAARKAEAERFWTERGLDDGRKVICYIGSLTKRASSDLVDIAGMIRFGYPKHWRLVICGDGDLRPQLEKHAGPHVMLTGWVGQPEITALMHRADIGLIPYTNSPDLMSACPNKFGEYLSAGLPVVSTLGGEITRRIGEADCGWAGSLAVMRGLHEVRMHPDEQAARRTRAAKAFAASFDARKIYPAFADHIERIAAGVPT